MVLEFLKSRIGAYIIFSIILAFMYLLVIFYKQKSDLYKIELKSCNYSISYQNESILQMKKISDSEIKKQRDLQIQIQKENKIEYEKLKKLYNLKIPEECQQAIEWGIEHSDYQR